LRKGMGAHNASKSGTNKRGITHGLGKSHTAGRKERKKGGGRWKTMDSGNKDQKKLKVEQTVEGVKPL